ncbi:hypothetical protein [Nonomuraea salmonea]|uniref:hypothetical protein n=1 Tax=Nonomuraea salmonea TaxID=46181 RepID=UPI002FED7F1B
MNSLTGAYVPGDSPLHRLPAGAKLAALALACTALVLLRSPLALAMAGGSWWRPCTRWPGSARRRRGRRSSRCAGSP